MNLNDYSFEMNIDLLVKGKLCLDANFFIKIADEESRNMLGSIVDSNVCDLCMDESQRQELEVILSGLKLTGYGRAVMVFKNKTEQPVLVDLYMHYEPVDDYEYVVEFWNINSVEHRYAFAIDNMWKYRSMLGQSNYTYYDYNLDSDMISIYRYVGKKSTRLFYDTLEVLYKRLIEESADDEKNALAVEMMLEQLRTGKALMDLVVQTNLLSRENKKQKLHIRGRFDDRDGHRMVYGTINNMSETDDDIPYYMTSAGVDSATGLLNKRSIVEYSEHILTAQATASRKHYMILLDIDDFKDINDNYGHKAGDQAISIMASTMTSVMEEYGIVGRYGGDEFYILTDLIEDEDTLRLMLKSIRQTSEKRIKEQTQIEKFSLSIGVALYPDLGSNYSELLEVADKALYIAKEKGKNRYIIYRKEMHENVQTGASRKSKSNYDEQSKTASDVIRSLFIDGKAAIESTLPQIIRGFDLDSIDLFYGENLDLLYAHGKYPSGFKAEEFVGNKRLVEHFDEDGVCIINNAANIKQRDPDIYQILQERNCMSMILVAYPNANEPEFLMNFNVMNRVHKWSDSEINVLSLYGNLVYEALRKE